MRAPTPRKPFQWDDAAYLAAASLGAALSLADAKQEASEAAGVSIRTIERWMKHPEFMKAVDANRAETARRIASEATDKSLHHYANRMAVVDEVEASIRTIIRERGEQARASVPGGKTGLMRTIVTERFGGETFSVETEHVIDKQLLDARNANTALAQKMAQDLEAVKDSAEERVTYVFKSSRALPANE